MKRLVPERPLPPGRRAAGQAPLLRRPPGACALSRDYLYAFDLFAAGYFWEAHEAWETLWRRSRDARQRAVLQALIQVAAASLQSARGRRAGARTIAARALRHLAGLGPKAMGVDLERLRAGLRAISATASAVELPLRVPPLEQSAADTPRDQENRRLRGLGKGAPPLPRRLRYGRFRRPC